MNVVVLAREKSSRYPQKHLHAIRSVPMLYTMLRRIQDIGARPILCTGPEEDNKSYVMIAGWAQADYYCEEDAPEWDLVSRHVNMAKKLKIQHFVEQSGDCPFVDLSMVGALWEAITTHDVDSVGIEAPYARTVAERAMGAKRVSWYEKAHEYLSLDDRGREQPGVHVPDDIYTSLSIGRHRPASVTPIKSSIDWPLEAAVADLIVRHLGHWPESDDDIEKVYREITVLNPEVDNTPPSLNVFNDPESVGPGAEKKS